MSKSASRSRRTPGSPQPFEQGMVTVTLPSWLEDEPCSEPFLRTDRERNGLDLTPMVDMVFLLLIFFMITASFNLQKKLDVVTDPAESTYVGHGRRVYNPDTDIVVEIDAENNIWIDGAPVDHIDTACRLLKEARSYVRTRPELRLRIDPESTHDKRIFVADAAALAGFRRIETEMCFVN